MTAISVVVPCRNEARSLRACLGALQAQDHPDFEVVVVDGASTDGGCGVAREMGARLLADDGDGPSAARNVGIREAGGDVVAFTDADCVPAPDWLSRIDETLAGDRGLAGVAGAMRMPTRTLLGRMEDYDARANYRGYITSNVAYRRDVLLAAGGFDERLECAEDYDLAWRLLDAGHRIAHDPRAIVVHDAPEVSGSLAGYLRKQLWYARHDVPALALAARRRSERAVGPALSAFENLAWAAGAACAPLSPTLGALALVGAGAFATRDVARAARAAGAPLREVPLMAAVGTAKKLARGLGTMLGAADALKARAGPARAPRSSPSGARPPLRAPSA